MPKWYAFLWSKEVFFAVGKTKEKTAMKFPRNIRFIPFLSFLMVFFSCARKTATPTGTDYPVISVQTTSRTLQTSYSATIRGRQDIDIYPQISGKITEVKVKEGQNVRKGQVLFVIDRIPYEAALRVADANLEAAKVGVESAELNYNSTKKLFDNKVVSSYELQTSLNALHTALATRAQMEAQQIDARNNLSYTEVSSPTDGVVGTIPFREGSLVSASMTDPLTTVSDNSEMYVYFSMNENRLLDIIQKYGTIEKAMEQMPDLNLKLSNGSIYGHHGRIESISGVINESTGTVSLRAVFPNPDRILFSGANGSVLFPETYTDIITIPQEATFELQDKILVYKVEEGSARSAKISVLPISDGKEYIVSEGLTPGDVIIASGAGLVKEGDRINPVATREISNDTTKQEDRNE